MFDADGVPLAQRFITDDAVSPLDLTIAPSGNILVSSEFPFRAPDAVTSIREYDRATGALVRVFIPPSGAGFHQPPGLRFWSRRISVLRRAMASRYLILATDTSWNWPSYAATPRSRGHFLSVTRGLNAPILLRHPTLR
ncbi:hypothetical protein [Paraburkholderia sp. GAS334]|uniref:hypothetical protein n=1 Tax=Paraburkholderia sp. GAS334 TaxID=3035131 RepID=UPI003D233CCF